MERHDIFFGLFCALLGVALVEAHTISVCYKLDPCTGEYEAAYGTYHSISEFSGGCAGNPSSKCPSGFSIIDGNSVPFDSLVLAAAGGLPNEPGWSLSDCTTCSGQSMSSNQVWQKATVTLSPGVHSVTVAATSAIETPWSCFPISLTVGGTVSSSITCPATTTVTQDAYPGCSAVATFGPATCSVDTATCPGSTCGISQEGGQSSGTSFPVGSSFTSWRLYVDGASTPQTCTHTVNVVDTAAPQNIACASDVTETCTSPSGAVATFGSATADDCNAITWAQTHSSGQTFAIGTTPVTFTATDQAGTSSTCSLNVNIVAGTMAWQQNCPNDMMITNFTPGPSGSASVSWIEPTAHDSCNGVLGMNRLTGPAPGSTFDVQADNPTTVTYQSNADAITGLRLTCSFEISFGYARLAAVSQQLSSPPPNTVAMYIPFTVTLEYVNYPQTSATGRLWLSDGSSTHGLQEYETNSDTFDTGVLQHEFNGPHSMLPGQYSLYATVDGNPFYFGNEIPLAVAIIAV